VKYLFVTYCFNSSNGQAMIGVYKRGLRLALELARRGHEVVFFCTGREFYHDGLTEQAEQCIQFIDIPFAKAIYEGASKNRATFLATLSEIKPDVVVIGEAPMIGPLLETTLSAVELKIPVVCLDNAFRPEFVRSFWNNHGPMFDGMILNGPSSLYWSNAPVHLLQVPPFVDPSIPDAERLVRQEFGADPEKLVTVLAYDLNVAELATSIFKELGDASLSIIYISPDTDQIEHYRNQLPDQTRSRTRMITPPDDKTLFGLIKLSKFAVTKCAYMQVTESLSLGTPVISFYYPGYFPLSFVPRSLKSFAYATDKLHSNPEILEIAGKYLNMKPEDMHDVHNGELGAAAKSADFLETISSQPRQEHSNESARLGFTKKMVESALKNLERSHSIALIQVRSTRLRVLKHVHNIHALVCEYSVNGERRTARLWGHTFLSLWKSVSEARQIMGRNSKRRLLYYSPIGHTLIELDVGVEILPSYLFD
jgi:hypothetical protein